MIRKLLPLVALAFFVSLGTVFAQGMEAATIGPLRIEQVWSRATAPTARTGAAYLTVSNSGSQADRLVAAVSPVSGLTELHTHIMEGGVARMQALPAIEIPAGGRATFAPGGLHVMFLDLKEPLRDGARFPLTLRFERAGEVTVQVAVSRAAPTAMPHHRH